MKNLPVFLMDETYGENRYIRTLPYGYLTYNSPHKKEEVIFITSNLATIKQKILDGWRVYPGRHSWILKSLEIPLCDISDITCNPTANPVELLAYYRLLLSLSFEDIKKQVISVMNERDFSFNILESSKKTAEIRIAGSDKRVLKVPEIVFRIIKNQAHWDREYNRVKKQIQPRPFTIERKLFRNITYSTRQQFMQLRKKYACIERLDPPEYIVQSIWNHLPVYDAYIFVPKAGLLYALGFMEDNPDKAKKVVFWESHTGIERGKEIRFPNSNLSEKHSVIIDRWYSGGTISYLKKVIQENNRTARVDCVALFPKRIPQASEVQYIVFLDTLIQTSKISQIYTPEDLFIHIVKNNLI